MQKVSNSLPTLIMNMQNTVSKFNLKKIFITAHRLTVQHWFALISVTLLMYLVSIVPILINIFQLGKDYEIITNLCIFIFSILGFSFGLGIYKIAQEQKNTGTYKFSYLFAYSHKVLPFLFYSLIALLIVCVPALILHLLFPSSIANILAIGTEIPIITSFFVFTYFTLAIVATRNTGILDGAKKSFKLVKSHFWQTLILLIILAPLHAFESFVPFTFFYLTPFTCFIMLEALNALEDIEKNEPTPTSK